VVIGQTGPGILTIYKPFDNDDISFFLQVLDMLSLDNFPCVVSFIRALPFYAERYKSGELRWPPR
jgi:hypothetical protein